MHDDPRVSVVYGAHVLAIDLENDRARQVMFRQGEREVAAAAEVVALGANALFNPHILLNSGDKSYWTGKGLGEQVGLDAIVHLENLNNVGGSTWVTANGYMLYEGPHRSERAACLIESNNAPYMRIESGKWRHVATFRFVFEELPDSDNQVKVSADGLRPEAHHKGISEYSKKSIKHMKTTIPQLLSNLPVEEVTFMDPYKTEAHILGTTRMSAHPNDGVVDKSLIHHRYRNLFVLGSGAFTTYSPNNPTLRFSIFRNEFAHAFIIEFQKSQFALDCVECCIIKRFRNEPKRSNGCD